MSDFSKEKQINVEILKRKKGALRRERFFCVLKERLKFLLYLPFFLLFFYLLFYSPFFVIKEIQINNLSYIDENEMLNDFNSLENENFFRTDLSGLRTEVIKKYAFIENIYTEKLFPNKVLVHVREKEPFVVVSNDQGCFLLDKMGFVLTESDCSSLKSNYSVKEVFGEDLKNIDFVVNTQSSFYNTEKIYKIVNVLDYYGYNVKLVEINNQIVEFKLHDERTFIFSFADEIETQLKRFIVVQTKIDYDDMSFESLDMRYQRPVLREK